MRRAEASTPQAKRRAAGFSLVTYPAAPCAIGEIRYGFIRPVASAFRAEATGLNGMRLFKKGLSQAAVGAIMKNSVVALFTLLALCGPLSSCGAQKASAPPFDPVPFADPLVGASLDGGALMPAACLPYSMVKLSPDTTRPSTAGYNPGEPIIGFSHTHIGGTGGAAFGGQILVRPQTGPLDISLPPSPKKGEFASPGYYAVTLTRDSVKAELTATERSGVHRYTFAANAPARLLIDVSATLNNGSVASPSSVCTGSEARFVSDREIEGKASFVGGYNRLTYTVYFAATLDQTPNQRGAWRGADAITGATEIKGDKGQRAGLYAEFTPPPDGRIGVRIGLSYSSIENARRHRAASDGMTFEQVKSRAEGVWRAHLNTIQVTGGSDKERRQFYTALYDSALAPVDLSGDNDAWSRTEPSYWDIYCIWDTFRSASPLLTLIHQERQEAVLRSLLEAYKQKGWLPDAWAYNQYAFSLQGGTNADVVFADAIAKGLGGFDRALAYQAVRKNATTPAPSNIYSPYGRFAPYFTRGYVPALSASGKTADGKPNEYAHAVSGTLEYAYNDFAVAQIADAVGEKSDAARFRKRSHDVFQLFNPQTRFFWGKDAQGAWLPGFDPEARASLGWFPIFYEGDAWQYRFSVPHDIQGLINRHGGPEAFCAILDQYFDEKRHWQGNEPGFLTPWLYDYAGRPDRTAERVRAILQQDYKMAPSGYAGDEDVGAMSSWYVFGAMGFYPNAGQDIYLLGSPLFSQTRLRLAGGKTLTITARGLSSQNRYIQSAKLNNKAWNKAWFRHRDIAGGADLVLEMGPAPTRWGTKNPPPSLSAPLREAATKKAR